MSLAEPSVKNSSPYFRAKFALSAMSSSISLSSASSTVLFNSRRAIFADHSPLDNLSGEHAPRRPPEMGEVEEMAEAPQTVRLGDELPEVERIEYSYKPVLGEVPAAAT